MHHLPPVPDVAPYKQQITLFLYSTKTATTIASLVAWDRYKAAKVSVHVSSQTRV